MLDNTPNTSLFFGQDKDIKLNHFLQTVPFLIFTDAGLKNIVSRFGLTLEELKQKITDLEAKEVRSNE